MSKSLRVLQLVQKPQRRGAEIFATQLAGVLQGLGHHTMSAYLYPYTGEGGLSLGPDDMILGGRENHPLETLVGCHPGLLWRLARTVGAFRPDVVQVNGARTVKYGAFLASLTPGRRWRLVYRNIGDPREWIGNDARRAFYGHVVMPRVDGVVSVSESNLEELQTMYGFDIPAVHLPRAVDVEGFVPSRTRAEVRAAAGTPPDAPVLLYVGSLTQEKRPDRLLRVAQLVRERIPSAVLWIVGDGPLRPTFEASVSSHGMADAVRLLGVSADVPDYMHAADVLVLTSDTEGTPGVVLEAGAARLPVVAPRVGGLASCVIDGMTGLLADAGDELGLALSIIGLLDDPARRDSMGEAARGWVSRRFSLPSVARQYVDFYSQLCGRVAAGVPGA